MARAAIVILLALLAFPLHADEASTAARLESIREDPLLLRMFLQAMPKGGDLHNHLSGAVYAETYIRLAVEDGLCIDTIKLAIAPCDAASETQVPAAQTERDINLYTNLLDAMSMRQFRPIRESGHDHFFATFTKFSAVSGRHTPEMLTEVVSRFARENVDYVETIFGPDEGAARQIGRNVKPGTSFADMRKEMLKRAVPEVVKASRETLNEAEKHLRDTLGCGTPKAQSGCESTVRYLFETHRAFQREQLFAELLVGFEMAKADPRVVGVNVVQPEDWYASMTNFDELMKMFAYLRPLYPKVRISTHAGELAPGLVTPEGMQHHIRDSVEIAGADRIGHGVDIAREKDAMELLRTMAKRPVAVEVCLTSNDVILGVTGKHHPLRLYLRSDVPIVLATDDPGVARNDMTSEWQRAVEEHGVTYADLKRFARNSIEYSFLDRDAKEREKARLERRLREFEESH